MNYFSFNFTLGVPIRAEIILFEPDAVNTVEGKSCLHEVKKLVYLLSFLKYSDSVCYPESLDDVLESKNETKE